jgi:hypothetical protein
MSTDPLNGLFTDLLGLHNTWLDSIIRENVRKFASSRVPFQASGCLLTDIGDFLVRMMEQVARLVEELATGDHIYTYTNRKAQEMEDETSFSELHSLEHLENAHRSLKCVSSEQFTCNH